jgi:hypothetical protein
MRLPFFVVLLALPGCGLTLDYDPPTDGGMDGALDAPGPDAGPECATEVDCDDGDRCNGRERCEDGVCVDGNDPITCPDPDDDLCSGVPTCEPSTGECVPGSPPSCPGDDGNPCNGIEACVPALGCATLDPLECDDGVDCTDDTCDPGLGCVFTPSNARCTDRAGGTCTDLGCVYGCEMASDCVSDDPCVIPTCVDGTCQLRRMTCEAGLECCGGTCEAPGCDDDEHCTRDVCDRALGCQHLPRIDGCDDGDACTTGDHCVMGTCEPMGGRACASSDPCRAGFCDPSTGDCDEMLLTGTPCLDDDPCTVGDTCSSGTCVPGMGRPTCFDANPCTADTCTSGVGCDNPPLPDGTSCGLGTTPATCVGGLCVGRSLCRPGMADCDGDLTCECSGRCVPDAGGGLVCVASADCTTTSPCGSGEECCTVPGAEYGTCYPRACLSCCLAAT